VAPTGERILEIGSGPANQTSRFLSELGELHGVDISSEVLENDALVSASVLDSSTYPMDDESFALCVSNYVLEHVADPDAHFSEVWRVLKPGGAYCFRTPNRYHYVSAVSWLTPHWFHLLVANRLRNRPSDAPDPYPTHYAANTQSDIRRIAAQSGFEVEELVLIEKEPSYGMSSRFLFLTFLAYERLVNSTELAANLRVNIFAVLRKPARLAH
jgi:ubiquinone/menaquinone biosynthesis C-methylase UbiE